MLDYGIIGNCTTSALVKKNASVDWMCFPTFSSPSIFGKLIDKRKGGSMEVIPIGKYNISQRYLPNTAILETTFSNNKNSFLVIDFFPRYRLLLTKKHEKLVKQNTLIRIIKPIKGNPKIKIKYDPKPDYASKKCVLATNTDILTCSLESFNLHSNIDHDIVLNSEAFVLKKPKYISVGKSLDNISIKRANDLLRRTTKYWKDWVNTLTVPNTHKDVIIRSAITLKLLTYSPTGAIIAAPTTSIPEEVGTNRTWDYRFCWIRDSALCVDALKKIGRDHEAKKLISFIIDRVMEDDYVPILYGINGETKLTEITLDHLAGYKNSKPVRVGNAAYKQLQHDIYGEILDIMYLYFVYYEYEKKISRKYWRFIRFIVNQIKFCWERPDSGIWEFRGEYRHYTHSKFMCYTGLDRAIKIAKHYKKDQFVEEWSKLADEIKNSIIVNGYNKKIKSFTMYYGGKELDAVLLHMTYHEFLDKDNPMIINTVKAIDKELRVGDFVQRYKIQDDFGKSKSTFTICAFWLIEALYYIGKEKKAKNMFHKLVKNSNHLGLFSEDIDIKTKELTGNFPQAYTHISLINAAILLSEWSVKRKKIELIERKKQLF